jgi:hypothetical protein
LCKAIHYTIVGFCGRLMTLPNPGDDHIPPGHEPRDCLET